MIEEIALDLAKLKEFLMNIELGLAAGSFNTKYAPLALLMWGYRHTGRLNPLQTVEMAMKTCTFTPIDKLLQVLFSMLADCEYIAEVNTKLKAERKLAQIWDWERFADQSVLSETLERLSLTQLAALREASQTIWRGRSSTLAHDWRGFLLLDLDLSGLPGGRQAEQSTRGYFSGKKTLRDGNWRG